MNENGSKAASSASFNRKSSAIPVFFQNKDLLSITGEEKNITREQLINKLNHLNFTNGEIAVIFSDSENDPDILIKAHPQPCLDDSFTCQLAGDDAGVNLAVRQPRHILIDDGLSVIVAPVTLLSLQKNMLRLKLPEQSLIKTKRLAKRRPCSNIECEISQNSASLRGVMIDFTPNAFSVDSSEGQAIHLSDTAFIRLSRAGNKIYSGTCRLKRSSLNQPLKRIVYAPDNEDIRLYPQRKNRNPRERNAAAFRVRFQHPFFEQYIERDIYDVATSGFSIRESPAEETLMTGMIIPDLTIIYSGMVEMKCAAQVIYRREDRENHLIQTGLAITDMDVRSYSRLNHLVGARLDAGACISTTVNMDTLWEFLFDTGFIYGEKYRHLHPYREAFRETYRKLYQDNPDIARHFTYERQGRIYGHIAMVHAYTPSWVIHHYSAKPLESKIPGLLILRQIIHFINGCYRFPSFGMNYVMTYYRPDNQIVDKIFGGFSRELKNPKGSSLDLFAYLHREKSSGEEELSEGVLLRECRQEDFDILKTFYEKASGGLLFDAFRPDLTMQPLNEKFSRAGFKRNCRTYCLCTGNRRLAFFIVNQSDVGLNLSDLLNSITVFVLEESAVPWSMLSSAIGRLEQVYDAGHIPLLIYPSDYPLRQGVHIDKQYQLWILTGDPYSDQYTEYMRRKFRIRYEDTAKS